MYQKIALHFTLFLIGVLMLTACGSVVRDQRRNAIKQGKIAEPVSLEVVKDIQMSKNEIYNNAILWLAESFKWSKAVIDLKDREIGTIAVNSSVDVKIYFGVSLSAKFKIKIDIKENKYRLKFFDVIMVNDDGSEKPIEQTKREYLEPKVIEKFNEISASLESYLLNAEKNKAW